MWLGWPIFGNECNSGLHPTQSLFPFRMSQTGPVERHLPQGLEESLEESRKVCFYIITVRCRQHI